jgi:hypothetical protein
VRRVRFVAAARREFLAEVIYYNEERAGLGARFTAAVEEATARAAGFPLTGQSSIGPRRTRLSYSLSHITLAVPAIGCRVFEIANRETMGTSQFLGATLMVPVLSGDSHTLWWGHCWGLRKNWRQIK